MKPNFPSGTAASEQRWTERLSTDKDVLLIDEDHRFARGTICNVSLRGILLRTKALVPQGSTVRVHLSPYRRGRQGGYCLAATVIRHCSDGMALVVDTSNPKSLVEMFALTRSSGTTPQLA